MSRSIQKWQSDFTSRGAPEPLQGHLMGEQHYQPLSAAGVWANDPYTWRSTATTGQLIFWDQRNDTAEDRNRTAAAIAETKRLRPLILGGDFFVLTNLDRYGASNMSASLSSWAAWQWAYASRRSGAAVFLRRSQAPASTTVALNYIDAVATYELRFFHDYALNRTERHAGRSLAALSVSLEANTSLLLEYERLKSATVVRQKTDELALIQNNQTRLDSRGRPVNAHQGSMIRGVGAFSSRFYLYGDWFRACKPHNGGCHCDSDPPGTGMEVSGIGIYSTADFATFRQEGNAPILRGYNEPRMVYIPSTRKYHMYLNFPLMVAVASEPTGPWVVQTRPVKLDTPRSGDMNVFVDDDGTPYIIYTSGFHGGADASIRVQRLAKDGLSAVPNATSPPFPPTHCEAPLMFRRGDLYYAAFGHACGCCSEGSELFVFTARHPLGPWAGGEDANRDAGGRRVVAGQSAFVVEVRAAQSNRSTWLWATDQWQSGETRSGNYQYWGALSFGQDGCVRPLEWAQSWELQL